MNRKKIKTLNQLKAGESGEIIQILGGYGLRRRLDSLGIRLGCRVTKVSSVVFRGPVTLRIGNSQLAVGFGMANKIIVEEDVIG